MSVDKSWAYIDEFGPGRITAWEISQKRAEHGGKPLGKTYWSNHKSGQRKRVKQRQIGGTTFFAYMNTADAASGGDGESLSHRLLKEAIAGLSGTKFKLGIHGEHDINITHGETEKAITTADGKYYADAYLRFTSTTRLGLRWSEEVYIEVNHTHAVPVDKEKELRGSRVPVVEVKLLKAFEYPYKDEDTSDPREAAHVNRIRNMLQKGFLAGRVISDHRSIQFLEEEVSRLETELRDAHNGLNAVKRAGAEAVALMNVARARVAELEKSNADHAQWTEDRADTIRNLQRAFDAEKEKVRVLDGALVSANATTAGLEKQTVRRYWIIGVALICLALVGLCIFVGYRQLFANRALPEVGSGQASEIQPVAQPATAQVPTTHMRPAAHIAKLRHHHVPAPTQVPSTDDGGTGASSQQQ